MKIRAGAGGLKDGKSVPKRAQRVEKVVVEPVGGAKHPEKRSKTLLNRAFRSPNGAHRRARRSFSTAWEVFGTPLKKLVLRSGLPLPGILLSSSMQEAAA